MALVSETLRVAKDRTAQVFRYLEALNQHRNPAKRQIHEQLWTLWFRDLPDHPSIRRGTVDESQVRMWEPRRPSKRAQTRLS